MVQGVGTPGPHDGGTAAPGTMGTIDGSGPEDEIEPLEGGSEFSRKAEVVDQRIVRAESRADRRLAVSERVPRQADARRRTAWWRGSS